QNINRHRRHSSCFPGEAKNKITVRKPAGLPAFSLHYLFGGCMADVVVIGAGYAGMSAAALLAHAGRKVLVLEENGMIGGRAHSCREESGYIREYGAHSHRLARKGIANEVFKRLGEEIDFLPHSEDAKLIFKGRLWERPDGVKGFLKTPMLSFGARLTLLVLFIKIR